MKMKQTEDETQIYRDKDFILDESGHYVMNLPEGTVTISTEVTGQRTGEIIKTTHYFTGYFSSETSQSFVNVSDFFKRLDILNSEIEKLKKENLEIRQRFDEIINEPELVEIKEFPDRKIEKIVLKFLKKHRNDEVYPSDIAFKYKLDARKVFEVCQKLKKEGKIV